MVAVMDRAANAARASVLIMIGAKYEEPTAAFNEMFEKIRQSEDEEESWGKAVNTFGRHLRSSSPSESERR